MLHLVEPAEAKCRCDVFIIKLSVLFTCCCGELSSCSSTELTEWTLIDCSGSKNSSFYLIKYSLFDRPQFFSKGRSSFIWHSFEFFVFLFHTQKKFPLYFLSLCLIRVGSLTHFHGWCDSSFSNITNIMRFINTDSFFFCVILLLTELLFNCHVPAFASESLKVLEPITSCTSYRTNRFTLTCHNI